MRFLIGIDVGIKNLGICVFDFALGKVVLWDVCSLVSGGKYRPQRNVAYVLDFIERYKEYFKDMGQIVVERQMRTNLRIIEAVFQTLFFDKCIILNPYNVKRHYDLSTGDYRSNKVKAVEWAREFVRANESAFTLLTLDRHRTVEKSDDMADALICVMYYLDTYSNQLTESVTLPE